MSPDELAVLFSSHIIAFVLVWLTNVNSLSIKKAFQAAGWEEPEHSKKNESVFSEPTWNVATFFGLKH
jgi:hypothetical protein